MSRGVSTFLLLSIIFAPNSAHAGATEALFGVAALAAVGSTAATAAIQADADKAIAKENAETQKYVTDSNNRLSQKLANIQSETQIEMAKMQAKNSIFAEEQKTLRQSLTLGAVDRANERNNRFSLMQMAQEFALRFRALDIQSRALDQDFQTKLRLARSGQVAQVQTSGENGLAVRRYGMVESRSPSERLLASVRPAFASAPTGIRALPAPGGGLPTASRAFTRPAAPAPSDLALVRHVPRPSARAAAAVPHLNHAHSPRD